MPEGAHPLPEIPVEVLRKQAEEMVLMPRKLIEQMGQYKYKGWTGAELVDNDGENWPLDFAAKLLQLPEKDLRDLVRIVNTLRPGALEPTGTIKMASFRRQGRHPRAYPGSKLLLLVEGLADLAEVLASP